MVLITAPQHCSSVGSQGPVVDFQHNLFLIFKQQVFINVPIQTPLIYNIIFVVLNAYELNCHINLFYKIVKFLKAEL